MKKKIAILILFLLFASTVNANVVEIERTSRTKLDRTLRAQIARERLPQVTTLQNAYIVISFPSNQIALYGITCSEIEFDKNEFWVKLIIGFHLWENPFVQAVAQGDGFYTVIRLRRNCIERRGSGYEESKAFR